MLPYSNYDIVLLSDVQMWKLTKFVIPKIKAHWRELAFCTRYDIEDVDGFDKDGRNLYERCENLLTNWLKTGHNPMPQTYQTLLKYIKKVDELTATSEGIERALIEGKTFTKLIYITFCFLLQLYQINKQV